MVGFLRGPFMDGAAKNDKKNGQSVTPSVSDKLLDPCIEGLEDFSSIPDFESIEGLFKDFDQRMADSGCEVIGTDKADLEEGLDASISVISSGSEVTDVFGGKDGSLNSGIAVNSGNMDRDEIVESFIETRMEKVSLEGASCSSNGLNACELGGSGCLNSLDVVKPDGVCVKGSGMDRPEHEFLVGNLNEAEKSDDDESSSSSSSSSDSSGEEEDTDENLEGAVGKESEVEEGEIEPEHMISWCDNDETDVKEAGPIRSKNELELLPPVPPVTVTLQSHHQTIPVGTILSIVDSKVVVEGFEQHNPLSEGSILWISERRSPLGIVDEVFGPVKNPYYVVRFNTDDQVPCEVRPGTAISFVEEFADHVLNDKSLYQKGYDASGEYDEENSDEVEFSDDEKEAEFRRMQKMKKRDTVESSNGRKGGKRRTKQSKNWNQNQCSQNRNLVDQKPLSASPVAANNQQHSPAVPPSNEGAQGPGFFAPNGMWSNGFPPQQLQSPIFPGGNNAMWMQQNQPSQPFQQPLQASMPMLQQVGGIVPAMPLNLNAMGMQPNIGVNQSFAPPWPMNLDPNILNMLQFAIGAQSLSNPQPLQTGVPNLQPPGSALHASRGRGGGRRGHQGGYRGRGRYQGRR